MKRKSDNETKAGRKRQRQGEIDAHTTDRRDKETENMVLINKDATTMI